MAKDHYRVPVSLARSFLDHEIPLTGGGWNVSPTPVKQLLFYLGAIVGGLWVMTATFVRHAGPLLIFLAVIWWIAAAVFFGGRTKTKELRFKTIPAFLAYLPPSARRVMTRRSSRPGDFYSIVGIAEIDQAGLIRFSDGCLGRAYLVVGSASLLLFDEDRDAILDRVDGFWRKVDPTCEYLQITTREPQRVHHQVAALEARNENLTRRDPGLLALMDQQYETLTDFVGGRFASIHQYLVLKADTKDALRRAHLLLRSEVESSGLMIKQATVLDRGDTQRMLATLYQGVEVDAPAAVSST